jgi:hypothetical protein
MPRYGFGHGRRSRGFRAGSDALVRPIAPSLAWNGQAGSGFTSTPTDPSRTTAKPAMRLMVPPAQGYSDDLLVGVYAGANFEGSLWDNFGLEKVVVHYEGNRITIDAPSYQTFSDANGVPVTYFGWWAKLKRDGRDGVANLYFEAVPKDSTMQRRVIGPYPFLPSAVVHDFSLTVAPSQPVQIGARYSSIAGALAYLASVAARNPLITIIEPGTYDLASIGSQSYSPVGRCRIIATVPITIGKSSLTTDAAAQLRSKFDGLHLQGQNITIDTRYTSAIWHEGGQAHWLDGINLVNSAGRGGMWRKGRRPIAAFVTGSPWITECRYDAVSYGGTKSSLLRGCLLRNGYNDVATDCPLALGNRVEDWNSTVEWHRDVDAMTVSYSGPESTATLTLAGANDATSRTFTARWGSNSATFAVGRTEALFNAGTNYNVSNVVNWLNGLGVGFAATLIDDSRRASAISLPGLKGIGFGPVNVKNTTLLLVTEFDVHADFVQQNDPSVGGLEENLIVADNLVIGMAGQDIFLTAGSGAKDFLIVNNSFYNSMEPSLYASNAVTASQVEGAHSHVVFLHNSWASQQINLRASGGYVADAYCIFANNVVRKFSWLGPATPYPGVTDNLIFAGQTPPQFATDTVVGGDETTLFAAPQNGDFTPAGILVSSLKRARLPYTRGRAKRDSVAACIGSN